jgi:hypothetical protein
MAEVKARRAIVKQTYYLGKKKAQVGARKGYTTAGFIHVEAKTANKLGLVLKLPTDIPSTSYSIEGGIIHQTAITKAGNKKKTPVAAKNGRKPVVVHLNNTVTKDINGRGVKRKVTLPESVQFGVPAWATIPIVSAFLKNAKSAKSFTLDGGEQHPINRGATI